MDAVFKTVWLSLFMHWFSIEKIRVKWILRWKSHVFSLRWYLQNFCFLSLKSSSSAFFISKVSSAMQTLKNRDKQGSQMKKPRGDFDLSSTKLLLLCVFCIFYRLSRHHLRSVFLIDDFVMAGFRLTLESKSPIKTGSEW